MHHQWQSLSYNAPHAGIIIAERAHRRAVGRSVTVRIWGNRFIKKQQPCESPKIPASVVHFLPTANVVAVSIGEICAAC